MNNDDFTLKRGHMLYLLRLKGIKEESILHAMEKVPRHLFVPKGYSAYAYEDHPVEIACEQTISQPYMVAFMTEAARVDNQSIVLEIGTGSGYQAAILAELSKEVYSVEVIPDLGESASQLLNELGYKNVFVKVADGYTGWKEKAPFEAIIVTAAAKKLPKELLKQLKIGGRLIIPLEDQYNNQTLVKIIKTDNENHFTSENLFAVRFVPMIEGENK
jgi:protein-L-isoaspartate(D-aspartate) O-methyltransferase